MTTLTAAQRRPTERGVAIVAAITLPLLALYLATLCIAYAWRALREPNRTRRSNREMLRLIVAEARCQWRMARWSLLRRGEDLPAQHGPQVLLVHGFGADGCSMWALRKRLHALGHRTSAPNLGRPGRPVADYVRALALSLDALEPGPLRIVCHSMGGVCVARLLAERKDLAARVSHLVIVASPLAGTASMAPWIPLPEASALMRGSPLVRDLPKLRELLPHALLTTLATEDDVTVYPISTTQVAGATAHTLSGIGHAELVTHPRAVALILAALGPPRGDL